MDHKQSLNSPLKKKTNKHRKPQLFPCGLAELQPGGAAWGPAAPHTLRVGGSGSEVKGTGPALASDVDKWVLVQKTLRTNHCPVQPLLRAGPAPTPSSSSGGSFSQYPTSAPPVCDWSPSLRLPRRDQPSCVLPEPPHGLGLVPARGRRVPTPERRRPRGHGAGLGPGGR